VITRSTSSTICIRFAQHAIDLVAVEITPNSELIPYACSEYRSDTASNLHCWFPSLEVDKC
jgi:hypothetical protein